MPVPQNMPPHCEHVGDAICMGQTGAAICLITTQTWAFTGSPVGIQQPLAEDCEVSREMCRIREVPVSNTPPSGLTQAAKPREAELSRSRLAAFSPHGAGDRRRHPSREQRTPSGKGPSRHFRAGRRRRSFSGADPGRRRQYHRTWAGVDPTSLRTWAGRAAP